MDYAEPILMRNNSQNAGCMRRFPASHSCQPRKVQWMRAAAPVCESPAASRAARTSSGVGFRAGLPARLRFGCLGTEFEPAGFGSLQDFITAEAGGGFGVALAAGVFGLADAGEVRLDDGGQFVGVGGVADLADGGHFRLLPTVTRGAVVVYPRFQYTHCVQSCQGVKRKIFEGGVKPSNAIAQGREHSERPVGAEG